MKYIFDHYKLKHVKEIHLSVDNNNENAIKLYKKHNFKYFFKNETYTLMTKLM